MGAEFDWSRFSGEDLSEEQFQTIKEYLYGDEPFRNGSRELRTWLALARMYNATANLLERPTPELANAALCTITTLQECTRDYIEELHNKAANQTEANTQP